MNAFQEPEHISMLRNTLRQFIDKEMPREKVNQWDKDDYFPRDVFDKLCALGVTSLTVSEEYGGSGKDMMAIYKETSLGGLAKTLAVNVPEC